MKNYENKKDGTMLLINPLMMGIDHDIETCQEIIANGIKRNITKEEFHKIRAYYEKLLYVKDRLAELDEESVGVPFIFQKYA